MSHLNWVVDSSFSVRVTWTLLHCLWQGCCCGILVLAGDKLVEQRSARLRYLWNWSNLFLLAVCLPVTFSLITVSDRGQNADLFDLDENQSVVLSAESAELSLKSGRDSAPPERPFDPVHAVSASRAAAQTGNAETTIGDKSDQSTIEGSERAVGSTDQTFRRISLWITSLYVTGVMLALVRLARGTWGGHRLRQSAQAIHDHELLTLIETLASRIGLRMIPTVSWCREISVPVVVGVLRPIVLLPVATVSGLSLKQLEALLLHELAHIRRFDPLLNLLQRIIEALFFFHPIVWFISRRISIEREHAADDMVLAQGWERPRYADALLRVAELSSKTTGKPFTASATMLGAAGTSPSEFKLRLLRVLEIPPPAELFPSQAAILLTLLAGACCGILVSSRPFNRASFTQSVSDAGTGDLEPALPSAGINPGLANPVEDGSTKDTGSLQNSDRQDQANWSEPKNGLRIRVVPVLSSMSEEAIDPTERVTTFSSPDDVAFAVEVESRSLETISLLDTRYGESFGPAKGKPSSNWFSQFLFSIELFDRNGNLVECPDVQIVNLDAVLSGALPIPLRPGEIHRYLLRPTRWTVPVAQLFEPGSYRVAIRYLGMPERVATRIKEYRPQSPTVDVWGGDLVSPPVNFVVSAPPKSTQPRESEINLDERAEPAGPSLAWGPLSNGLRASVSVLPRKSDFAHGEVLQLKFHVQNVGDKPVTLASPLKLSSIPINVSNQLGEGVQVQGVTQFGRRLVSRTTINPAQTIVFDAGNLGLALTSGRVKSIKDKTNRWLVIPAGEYSMNLGSFFDNHLLLKDGNDKILAPLEGDWVGELKSGEIPLKVVNETIHCEIVDAVTGNLIPNATTSFLFIKPKSGDAEEETVGHILFARGNTGRVPFVIPDSILQRADREELELRWIVGNHPAYERHSPVERIPLKRFFQSDSKYIHDVLGTIRLTPKKQGAALDLKIQPQVKNLPDHLNVMAIGYDRKNNDLVSVSTRTDVSISRWDVETGQHKHDVQLANDRHGKRMTRSRFTLSEDCQRVMASLDRSVGVWDTSTGRQIQSLLLPPELKYYQVTCLCGNSDLSVIAAGLMPGVGFLRPKTDARAVVWDVMTGRVLQTVIHPEGSIIQSVALSPDGELIATSGQFRADTYIWKIRTGELLHVVPKEDSWQYYPDSGISLGFASQVLRLRFSPDGKQIAIGHAFGIKLIEAESGRLLHRFDLPNRSGSSGLVFSLDGSKLARVGTDKIVPIWSTQSGELIGEIPTSSRCGTFVANGQSFVVERTHENNTIEFWPLNPDGVATKE